jgi:hypothetical protein
METTERVGISRFDSIGSRAAVSAWFRAPFECVSGRHRIRPCVSGATGNSRCVRTVSHTPRNPGATQSFTGTGGHLSGLRKSLNQKCVGGILCASARTAGVNFQACSIDHSDISPFKINDLRAVWIRIAQKPPSRISNSRCPLVSTVCRHARRKDKANCVRPPNALRSLTAISGLHAKRFHARR